MHEFTRAIEALCNNTVVEQFSKLFATVPSKRGDMRFPW
jgi:hypothetical protein